MTISKELEATLQLAVAEAKRRRHEYLTVEHLLLALCVDPIAGRILRARNRRAVAGEAALARRGDALACAL